MLGNRKVIVKIIIRGMSTPTSGGTQVQSTTTVTTSADGQVLYAQWEAQGPKLSSVVKVGDYVNYPVEYENVATYDGSYTASLNGWRVLSVEDDGTVNLVSAGVPLKYYHGTNANTSITKLLINFLETETTTSGLGYRLNGFDTSKTLTESFTNKYTATYETDTSVSYPGYNTTLTGTKTAGTPKVRAMTKEDLDKVYGSTTKLNTYVNGEEYNDLLAIPCSDKTDYYAWTWLASAVNSTRLWFVSGNGYVFDSGSTYGVRPVVSLKTEVTTTGQDASGVWQLQ